MNPNYYDKLAISQLDLIENLMIKFQLPHDIIRLIAKNLEKDNNIIYSYFVSHSFAPDDIKHYKFIDTNIYYLFDKYGNNAKLNNMLIKIIDYSVKNYITDMEILIYKIYNNVYNNGFKYISEFVFCVFAIESLSYNYVILSYKMLCLLQSHEIINNVFHTFIAIIVKSKNNYFKFSNLMLLYNHIYICRKNAKALTIEQNNIIEKLIMSRSYYSENLSASNYSALSEYTIKCNNNLTISRSYDKYLFIINPSLYLRQYENQINQLQNNALYYSQFLNIIAHIIDRQLKQADIKWIKIILCEMKIDWPLFVKKYVTYNGSNYCDNIIADYDKMIENKKEIILYNMNKTIFYCIYKIAHNLW